MAKENKINTKKVLTRLNRNVIINTEREVMKMKKNKKVSKVVGIVVCALLVVAIIGTIFGEMTKSAKTDNNTEDTTQTEQFIDVTTTMMNAIDDSFTGNYRIEQMFVESVSYTKDNHCVVLLEDTEGYLWELIDVEMYLYDDVLVLLADNYTDTIVDDAIIHCWIGIE